MQQPAGKQEQAIMGAWKYGNGVIVVAVGGMSSLTS